MVLLGQGHGSVGLVHTQPSPSPNRARFGAGSDLVRLRGDAEQDQPKQGQDHPRLRAPPKQREGGEEEAHDHHDLKQPVHDALTRHLCIARHCWRRRSTLLRVVCPATLQM